MKRIALDPDYPGYMKSRFDPLPERLQEQMDCVSFRAEPPNRNFLDRLFNNVADEAVKSYKDWKEEWQQRRQEKKQRRRRN